MKPWTPTAILRQPSWPWAVEELLAVCSWVEHHDRTVEELGGYATSACDPQADPALAAWPHEIRSDSPRYHLRNFLHFQLGRTFQELLARADAISPTSFAYRVAIQLLPDPGEVMPDGSTFTRREVWTMPDGSTREFTRRGFVPPDEPTAVYHVARVEPLDDDGARVTVHERDDYPWVRAALELRGTWDTQGFESAAAIDVRRRRSTCGGA